MRLAELWRYPVKSMAGERLQRAWVSKAGIEGDRIVQVRDSTERVLTARQYPRLLGLSATLDADGEARVDGRPWEAAETASTVRAATGVDARLVRDESLERFDVLPLLVATDGAIAALGVDGRRLRPNLVIGDVPGLAERTWEGRTLRIGDVHIRLDSLRGRCVMTTFDPDTQVQDPSVLRRIARQFGGRMALNAAVLTEGWLTVGAGVELID